MFYHSSMRRLSIFLLAIALGCCSCSSAQESSSETIDNPPETTIGDTQPAESTAETTTEPTTEPTTATTTSETTEEPEVDFVTSLPYMRQVDFDGEHLQDGIYVISDYTFDEDGLGVTCDVSAHYYLLEGDIELLEVGDQIIHGDYTSYVTMITDRWLIIDEICYLEKQFDGTYYINEDNDGEWRVSYPLVDDYYLSIAPDVLIYDCVDIYGITEEQHEAYCYEENPYWIRYWSVGEFVNELTLNDEYCLSQWGTTTRPAIFVIIEDQTITEMYINPSMHQGWRLYTYAE